MGCTRVGIQWTKSPIDLLRDNYCFAFLSMFLCIEEHRPLLLLVLLLLLQSYTSLQTIAVQHIYLYSPKTLCFSQATHFFWFVHRFFHSLMILIYLPFRFVIEHIRFIENKKKTAAAAKYNFSIYEWIFSIQRQIAFTKRW